MAGRPAKSSGGGMISGIMRRVSLYSSKDKAASPGEAKDDGADPAAAAAAADDVDTRPKLEIEIAADDAVDEFDDGNKTPVGSPSSHRSSVGDLHATPVRGWSPGRKGHARSVSDVAVGSMDLSLHFDLNTTPSGSEDGSDDPGPADTFPTIDGTLSKWTNYMNGWQNRHVVVREGTLSYFRSENEGDMCRAAVDLNVATVQRHKFDHLRFDVRFADQCFYFRTTSEADRDRWVDVLTETQSRLVDTRSAFLHKSSSVASLTSLTSIGSGSIRTSAFQEKLTEIKTFHGLLTQLVEKIQIALPADQETEGTGAGRHTSQFLADCLMFKSTSNGMMASVEECVAMASRREEEWRKRLTKANEKRKQFEILYKQSLTAGQRDKHGPDMQEGPHCQLTEEEWFDAIAQHDAFVSPAASDDEAGAAAGEPSPESPQDSKEPGHYEVLANEGFAHTMRLRTEVGMDWEEMYKDPSLAVYRTAVMEADGREHEKSKVLGNFSRITARELVEYAGNPDLMHTWDTTLETFKIIETDEACKVPHSVIYLTHKRVWPAAQRESLMLVHKRRMDDNSWAIISRFTEHDKMPVSGGRVRTKTQIALFAKTILREGATAPYSRDDVSASIEYFTDIDPGGWAPSSVVQAVARRELPKLLRALEKNARKWYDERILHEEDLESS